MKNSPTLRNAYEYSFGSFVVVNKAPEQAGEDPVWIRKAVKVERNNENSRFSVIGILLFILG